MHAPRFRSSYRVDVVDDRRLFLMNEDQAVIVEHPDTVRVAALIDGARTAADIMRELGGTLPPERVFLELAKLQRSGHVVSTPDESHPFQAYVESWGAATDGYRDAAGAFRAVVLDWDGTGLGERVAESLAPSGVQVRTVADETELPAAELVVVVVDDYLDPRLEDLNRRFVEQGQTWMPVKAHGRQVWVGPRMVPGDTGCWSCLAERLGANRQAERYLAKKLGEAQPRQKPAGVAAGASAVVAGLVANELFAVSAGLEGALLGRMRTVDMMTMESVEHTLVALPQCPVSGSPERRGSTADVTLHAVEATHREDGGYRVCTPAETYARLEHHISPFLGAVSRLASLNNDREGITYSFVAGHNFGMTKDSMDLLRSNMRGQSGGKGRTEIQAKVSGVCEALERYSGVWTPDLPEIRSTWQDLPGRKLHPDDVLLYADHQFDHRDAWNHDPRNRLQRIPERFDETRQISFTEGRSLTHGDVVMIPSALVWFGHPELEEHQYAITDSNGGAAGNTMDEAVLQGLCEVYERDAVALWWFNRVRRPGVDLDSFDDPYIQRMRDFYATMDREIWVLDLSNDLSVPTFAAVSRRDHEVEDIMVAFGAHPDPDIALFRALTELNQFLPFIADRDAEGNTVYGVDDAATLEWCQTTTVANAPWVTPDPDVPATRREDLVTELPATLEGIVRYCVDDLARAGMETIVVNQTRPDIELNVAKVFVPGMRHFWKRTGAGRLYDVPVALGWLPRPLREDELNPVGVFF